MYETHACISPASKLKHNLWKGFVSSWHGNTNFQIPIIFIYNMLMAQTQSIKPANGHSSFILLNNLYNFDGNNIILIVCLFALNSGKTVR